MGSWTPEKVEAFKSAFYEFIQHVRINSKNTGSNTVLGDNIYEAQRRFLDCVFEGLAEDIHDFKILKSRQLGISTMSRALSIFWLGMHPGLQGAMVFDTQGHREEARNEIMTMIKDLPARLKFPSIKKDSRDMLILSNDSTLRFLSAGTKKSKSAGTLGRSSGINFAHLSEICSYENEEGLVSFKNALSEVFPDRLMIWESTARGFNLWYRMWEEAKRDNLNQKTCFIGWWAHPSQVILRGTPKFARYGMEPPTADEQKRIDEVSQLYNFEITQEQLAWYRCKMNPQGDEGGDDDNTSVNELQQQEQPFTEEEAFLTSGSTFFSGEKITEIIKRDVSEKYQKYNFINGSDFFHCDFMPVVKSNKCDLKIWEEPDQDGVYVVSADPAYGHDEANNHSGCQVLRCYADCIEQVAEFASSSIQPQAFAWMIASLAGWYKNSRVILEINGPGEAVWIEYKGLKGMVLSGHMKSMASELGLRDIFVNVRDYMYARQDSANGGSGCYHWKTSGQTKVAIFERLRDFTGNGTLILRSFETAEEMKTVVRSGDQIGAEGRNRDDRTFCLAMGIRCWEDQVRRNMSNMGKTREHEIAARRMTIKDQIMLFSKNKLDSFLKSKANERNKQLAASRRQGWRNK